MKSLNRPLFIILFVAVTFLVTACSSSQNSSVSPLAANRQHEYARDMDMPAAAPAPAEEAAVGLMPLPEIDRKIVSTVHISLLVGDTDVALAAINALVDGAGGYIAQTNLYQSGQDSDQLEGALTLRVPAARLDETLVQLAGLAVKVESQSMNREDVTDQYVDLQARLRNFEATEKELHTLLTEVRARPDATANDILAVHQSLTQIRGEIEQLQGRINLLDNTVGLSTVNVNLRLDGAALPIVEAGWRPAATLTEALRALTGTVQGLGNLAIWWTVYILPVALILLTPILIGFFVARRFFRRRRNDRSQIEIT